MSEPTPELNAALAAAQGEFPPITKSKEVKTGSYSYTYAPLEAILDQCRPVLSKNGLALVQLLEDGANGPGIRTELRHTHGGVIGSSFPLPTMPQKAQELGSLLTYLRRYAIVAMLGIAAEDDDDGAQATASKAAAKKTPARKELEAVLSKTPMIDDTRLARLMILFKEKQIDERTERLDYTSSVIGRPIATSKELTKNEADDVIRQLEQYDKDDPQTYPF